MWQFMNNWDFVLPPSRPDETYLTNIRVHIQDINRDEAVAVLGSTPEFRDLLFEMGFKNVFILEKNQEFHSVTNSMRVYQNLSNETLLLGDWLDLLPDFKSFFSLILSDLTMGNIPYEQRKLFYTLIFNSLRVDGIFIDKVLFHNEFLNYNELIDKYKKLPINLISANKFNCEAFFCSDLLLHSQTVNTDCLYSFFRNINDPYITQLLRLMEKITPPGCVWYYGKYWRELEKDYIISLSNVSIIYSYEESEDSPYYMHLKYYFVKKEID